MREFLEKIKSSKKIDGSITLDLQQRVKEGNLIKTTKYKSSVR